MGSYYSNYFILNYYMKTIIFYAYYETSHSIGNLEYFSKVGITDDPNFLYVIIINGYKCSIDLPIYNNCIVLKKDNTGFDFGAYNFAIKYLEELFNCKTKDFSYDYFIFLNAGVTGPFLPTYYNLHWTNVFNSKINEKVKLVGTTIVCLPPTDDGGHGPRIEGFCFATDKIGLDILIEKKNIFMQHSSKYSAIIYGEYGLSKAIFEKGFTIDCLLYKYQNIDWTNKKNWDLNSNIHPSRKNSYDGISIHPFEVVFHKWYWSDHPNELVSFEYLNKYIKWKLESTINN